MIRAVQKLNSFRNVKCARKFSTNPPPKNSVNETRSKAPNSNNNNTLLLGGGVAVAGVIGLAYALETDPVFSKSMANTPGISLLDPVRSGLVSMGIVTKDEKK